MSPGSAAVRAVVRGDLRGEESRDAIVARARALGLMGWARLGEDGSVELHAEGAAGPIDELNELLRDCGQPEIKRVRGEGHEQFAVRGVSAGVFVVQEHAATARHFDLRLEVDGVMRSWAVPKGPSLDPAVKRLAIEVGVHDTSHNAFEGKLGGGAVIIWDQGTYEQGGRVAWPEALTRGHAVFVLHGEKLHGGFALQRTRPRAKAQWLLIKRRDDGARPGSDIAAEEPRSVVSGQTLDELLE